jgi:hypothetical protein
MTLKFTVVLAILVQLIAKVEVYGASGLILME